MSGKPDPRSTAAGRDERTFFGRWSARKRGATAPSPAVRDADPDAIDAAVPGHDPLAEPSVADAAARVPASDATAWRDDGRVGTGADPADGGRTVGPTVRGARAGGDGASGADGGPDGGLGGGLGGGQSGGSGDDSGDGAAADEEGAARTGTDTGADTDEPVLTDADMPPIGTLDANSDLSAFFSKGVSAGLRRAALRQVFRQPAFNVRDGLNDYDGDYTVFEPLGDTVTADMKFHAARLERKRLEEERLAEEARLEDERERLEREAAEAERATIEEDAEEGVEEGAVEGGATDRETAEASSDGSAAPGNGTTEADGAERRSVTDAEIAPGAPGTDGTGTVDSLSGVDAANDAEERGLAAPPDDVGGPREASSDGAPPHHASNEEPDDGREAGTAPDRSRAESAGHG